MKILYIAHDCCDAEVAARALAKLAPNVRLSWAATHDAALDWLSGNPDIRAVIADRGREDAAFDSFLEQARTLGITAPIAAIAPEHLEAFAAALEAERLGEHDTALARTTRICTALQGRSLELEAALHDADQTHAAREKTLEQLLRREADLSAAAAEAAARCGAIEGRLADVEASWQCDRERAAAELAAATGRHARVAERLAEESLLRTALEERIALAERARADAEGNHKAERAALTTRLADREAQHQSDAARINRICIGLQQRLLELETTVQEAGQRHTADSAVIARLQHEADELRRQLDVMGARSEALEQRLREAQRLEAVGRVASEVATTCDTLLSDVSQGGRQWLASLDSDTRLRQQGELLLGDVTRAAGFLRQFAVYGQQQISNVPSVDLAHALRELSPILKRVLGDDIALLLPKTTNRFDVDVDGERVERILINVANYARTRMPHGGRVKIQLASAVVDREFVASHPEVRLGDHVLVTISEVRGPVWPALPIALPIGRSHAPRPASPSDRPGMDLGSLVALISDAGGHLWMSAEPEGNMTLRIHLPKRSQDTLAEPAAAASGSGRVRHMTRWFRH